MKTPFVLTSVLALLALQGASADQPNFRTRAQSPDDERREERAHGIKGFFKGVLGEIREGHDVIRGGIHEVHDGIKARITGRDDEPEFDGPARYGYQSPPPPPLRDGGGFRLPRDPGPPSWRDDDRARLNASADTIPASGPRERTQPRKPAEPKPARENTPTPPPVNLEPAPVKREAPVVDKTPERSTPSVVTPKKRETPPAPVESKPAPKPSETPPTPPVEKSPVAPEEESAAPQPESKPVAKDEAGRPLPDKPDFPTATATKDPGIVLSPYPPHDMLDVKGMAPGSLAKDPATGQVFRVP